MSLLWPTWRLCFDTKKAEGSDTAEGVMGLDWTDWKDVRENM